jgi:hypothetical protein
MSLWVDGTITITADVTDLAGNQATQATRTLIKDTALPTLAIDDPLMTDNRVSDAEQAAVVISGTSNAEDNQDVTLTITDGDTPQNTVNATVTVTGGVWTYTADISGLFDGNIDITANVFDLADNPAAPATRTLVKDKVAPTLAIHDPLMIDNIVNNGEQAAFVISGTSNAEDNQDVTLTITGSTIIIVTATITGGDWTQTVDISTLADGNIAITADVSDLAGNPATQAPKTVAKDAALPTLAIDDLLMTDDIVNDVEQAAVVISGTSNAEDNQDVALIITDGANPPNTLTVTATVTGGVWSYTADISAMADGIITITADVSDLAGNPKQTTKTLVKDKVAPTLAIHDYRWINHYKRHCNSDRRCLDADG